jgi:hypothetical protein
MGKLSDEDWRVIDRDLRAQAIEILRRLDELDEEQGGAQPAEGGAAEPRG